MLRLPALVPILVFVRGLKVLDLFIDWWILLSNSKQSLDNRELKLAWFMCWHIWKARNNAIYNAAELDPRLTFSRAQKDFEELTSITIWQSYSLIMPHNSFVKWSLPSASLFKLNVDASFDECPSNAAYGFSLRNASGFFLDGGAAVFSCSSSLAAEGLGLRAAIKFVIDRNLVQCSIETNAL
ncbi:uncharacterized protein LOC131181392 [Hevea brasiliensis]|uniref:uncharacterized protein LOC131181392 n=1 Tax=Hevea brasiliensis TaxID=3981 RepID=UPI0025D68733|nr:uncharacterized protein LOC131181392 [Hevea brasiliensis]